ncbi:hypothetical protein [Cloacibacillus evryensis]|uniref:hypothetical protein n=1 Tax=Cloacibacillus evryensis TaxID=508460 RepID=UPI00210B488A|nr:hypothetical protein [Cloacibacillus evryensis]MCQ4765510.1 hypothetical protein [Cloacibacillus evryensis]
MPKNVPYAHYRIDSPESTFPETTRNAYKMTDARSGRPVWIPRSCTIIDQPNDMGRRDMYIPRWLLRTKSAPPEHLREGEYLGIVELVI